MPRTVVIAALAVLAALPTTTSAQGGGAKQTTYALIRCESPGGRESFCPADTRRGVRLVTTVSGRCQLGRTWGYDAEGIWVRGCAAEFEIGTRGDGYGWGWGHQEGAFVNCASENYRYTVCEATTRGGVRLINQISRAECVEGRSWGFDRRGIWVDQGCAGEFEVGGGRGADAGGYPVDGARPGDDYGGGLGQTFLCESRDGRRRSCAADLRGRTVTVVRNISREACEEGFNYGVDSRGIWVDGGCRAEFRIIEAPGRRGYDGGAPGRTGYETGRPGYVDDRVAPGAGGEQRVESVRCESKDYKRRLCSTGQVQGVELRRQLSKATCVEGSTWGWDYSGIWVDQGCGGEFAVYR